MPEGLAYFLSHSTDFWYSVSFVIFVWLAYKYGSAKLGAGLDAKIAEIANNVAAAEAVLEAKTSAAKILKETEEELARRKSLSQQNITEATQFHIRSIQLELSKQIVAKSEELWHKSPASLVPKDLKSADFGV